MKREHYQRAKSLGYSGPLKWIGSTTAQWRAIAEQLSAQANTSAQESPRIDSSTDSTPALVHLLSIYPIRKRILRALGPAYLAVLRFVVRGLDPARCKKIGEQLKLKIWSDNGHFALLEWGLSIGMRANSYVFIGAAEHGRIDILELLARNVDEDEEMTCEALQAAAECGQLDVIKWIREREGEPIFADWWDESANTIATAIRHSHKNMLPELVKICRVSDRAFYEAARIGDAKLLDWLYKHISVHPNVQDSRKYVRVMPEQALEGAAAGGHLELLCAIADKHFAHLESFGGLVDHAIRSSDIDTVRYAAERFGVDLHACRFAASSNVEILEYIVAKVNSTAPIPDSTVRDMHAHAALDQNSQATEWLIAHGYPLTAGVYAEIPAGTCNVEALKYLRKYDCPWNEDVFLRAARFESEQVLAWLWDHGCPVDITECMRVIWQDRRSPEKLKRVIARPRESPVKL